MTGDVPARVAEVLDAAADLCQTVAVDDWQPADCETLLPKIGDAEFELVRFADRVRAVAGGGFDYCHEPPDLAGQCTRCGQQIAPPVAAKPGCNPIPKRMAAVLVRTWRLARTLAGDLRGAR